jgi:hypothetical protein
VTHRRPSPATLAAILAAHLVVTALTWRSLRRRTAAEVRGSKRLWRIASASNTGWSIAYFLFGRKRAGR